MNERLNEWLNKMGDKCIIWGGTQALGGIPHGEGKENHHEIKEIGTKST